MFTCIRPHVTHVYNRSVFYTCSRTVGITNIAHRCARAVLYIQRRRYKKPLRPPALRPTRLQSYLYLLLLSATDATAMHRRQDCYPWHPKRLQPMNLSSDVHINDNNNKNAHHTRSRSRLIPAPNVHFPVQLTDTSYFSVGFCNRFLFFRRPSRFASMPNIIIVTIQLHGITYV